MVTYNDSLVMIRRSPIINQKSVTDFGTRAISNQNFSRMIAIPKVALQNCGKDLKRVNVSLVQDGDEHYIKLTPVSDSESCKGW